MVCKYIKTCMNDITLKQFSDSCVVMEEFDGCPCSDPPHLKHPSGWVHYFRITYNSLESVR